MTFKKHSGTTIFLIAQTIIIVLLAICFFCSAYANYKNSLSYISYNADTMAEIDELKKHGKPMIIAFGADYCPTCVNYKPYIKELHTLYGDEIIIKYIDTVEHEAIRQEYNIELIPSTIFYYANGGIFLPGEEIAVSEPEIFDGEKKHESESLCAVTGAELGLNDFFEFGINKHDEGVYCKYVGLLDLVELKEIAEDLQD